MPSASVVVCTRGRPVSLVRTLRSLALLRYPHELILIRDPGDAHTLAAIAGHAPAARTADCREENLAQARNIGLRMAQGDIVAFIDDDAVPEPDWLDQIATAYADPGVAAAGGFIRDGSGFGYQARVVIIDPFGRDVKRPAPPSDLPAGWFTSLTGTNFSVRRDAALAICGFDEQYAYFLEETDILLRLHRAGGRIAVVPGAEVTHYLESNRSRGKAGMPLALRAIGRSKAYFCHVNRQPGVTDQAIAAALRQFLSNKTRKIALNLCLLRLNRKDAAILLRDLRDGIRQGEAAAQAGRKLLRPAEPEHAAAGFGHAPLPRSRLCVLIDGEPEEDGIWPRLQSLAATHELTILAAVPGWRRHVRFIGGMWVHRLPLAWRIATGGSASALRQEFERISPRRGFTHVFSCPAFEPLAARLGLERVEQL